MRLGQLERLLEQVLVVAVCFELHGAVGQQVAAEPFRTYDWHGLEQNDDVQTAAFLARRRLANAENGADAWDRPRLRADGEASQRCWLARLEFTCKYALKRLSMPFTRCRERRTG